ncbi:Transmembrane and coiled-coil domain-containing protein 4 [Gracilariopsis chorda]|uniref:Transmembrane and coiled-coil domain-containing protein 4 n=1 Tax=Gracilariopsis chorda TaxID=448386 RepID=A0A2V3IEP8_9FLOR|nr:Transmembrane and coiled-coil domain-containing protein 4 [Gracilariopsis chorda]|eukprot:PXF39670.1 Transmembrane and coiled-coil domain-containing protein 4 [Gracilariopsis chorda]
MSSTSSSPSLRDTVFSPFATAPPLRASQPQRLHPSSSASALPIHPRRDASPEPTSRDRNLDRARIAKHACSNQSQLHGSISEPSLAMHEPQQQKPTIDQGSNNTLLASAPPNSALDQLNNSSDHQQAQPVSENHTSEAVPIDNPLNSPTPAFSLLSDDQPLKGFHTLDPVQRYALGALGVVLLNHHATDLNGVAFARTQATNILQALNLSPGQQTALLALEPTSPTRADVISDCVNLVGDEASRFLSLQAMLALSVATGTYDARSRAFLAAVSHYFRIPWQAIAAVELAIATHLLQQAQLSASDTNFENSSQLTPRPSTASDDSQSTSSSNPSASNPKSIDQLLIARRKKKMRVRRVMKIGGITLVGGVMFGLTGGLIAPALLTALAGVGVTSAAGLAASGTVASTAVVGGLFGFAGAGFTAKKARNRIATSLEEFDFEHPGDPRVIEERKRRMERERKRWEKMVARQLAEEAANTHLAIENVPSSEQSASKVEFDPEKELPRPPTHSEDEDDEYDDEATHHKKKSGFGKKKKKKKKREKRKVGIRGLESTSNVPSLHVCICVPAWLTDRGFGSALDQFEPALKLELPCSQHIALRWDSRRLFEMAMAFAKFWASKATVTTLQQTYPHAVAAASTMAGAVAFAIAMPLTIMSCMDYVDNPWSILVSRSNGAGDELADVLVERSYGNRPVTLFAYSLGARVVFKCLESLASRKAHGIVDNVFLMGGAITADPERWKKFRGVVAGRIVNAYGSDDWALAFFHRGCGHGMYVAGLRKVELDGVENLNMAYLGIEGHRELKDCIPRVMRAMGVGTGYITMPPAKLVKKRARSKNGNRNHSLVCEEPSKQQPTPDNSPSTAVAESDSESAHSASTAEHMRGVNDITLPSAIADENSADENANSRQHDKMKSEKSNPDGGLLLPDPTERINTRADIEVDSGNEIPIVSPSALDDPYIDEKSDDLEVEKSVVPSTDIVPGHVGDEHDEEVGEGGFDWEKQRRIWEEQERQIQERGYADSAIDIEARGKVILGVSVEIAGRRLHPFVEKDAEIPVPKKEEVFTNCLNDQRGVVVRVYEHEERTKSVSMNMLRRTNRYPKLLGEIEVLFQKKAPRGDIRVAVSMSVNEGGDIIAKVEERLEGVSVGEQAELIVPRSELCTMEERLQLEAAERKRVEAQKEKERLKQAGEAVKALPAPQASDREDQRSDQGNDLEIENNGEPFPDDNAGIQSRPKLPKEQVYHLGSI